ncbi:MAG: phytanoyl-CoA dioxygenase family protein [Pseudomonadota bacterium]
MLKFSATQIDQFHGDGYLVLPALVPKSMCDVMRLITFAHLDAAVEPLEYESEVGYPGAPTSLHAPGGRTVRRLRNAYRRHRCFSAWAGDPGVVTAVQQLLGEPICLTLAHHNCVMTKHPEFGSATGWHRDMRYWSFERPDLVCVWLALGSENADNGGLRFIPGSHRLQMSPEQLDPLDFLRAEMPQNHRLLAGAVPLCLHPGDVVFFHSGLFHAAGRNISNEIKASIAFAYHGVSNTPLEGSRSAVAGSIELPLR